MAEQSLTPTPKELILKLLAEYRYLTVKQLWDKSGAAMAGKSVTQTRVELNRLKQAGLVTNHVIETHKGGAAEKYWMLRRPGAQLVGITHFDNRYRRPPSFNQAREREMQLLLEEQVDLSLGDWKLLKPKTYNSAHPIPRRTEHFYLLCMAVTWNYYKATGKMPDDLTGPHTLGVPLNPNQYIAYRSVSMANSRYAVVFIAPPERAGLRYWHERIKQFHSLTSDIGYGRIQVYALFRNDHEVESFRRAFPKCGIEPLKVWQVSRLLSNQRVD